MYTYIYHIVDILCVYIYIYTICNVCVCMCVQSTYGDTGSQVVAEPDSGNGIRFVGPVGPVGYLRFGPPF